MRHSLVGRRCLSLFTTMVPAVPAPRTTSDLMVVVMSRRYPGGYAAGCEPADSAAVTSQTEGLPHKRIRTRPGPGLSGGLEPPTEEPGHERKQDVGHPRRRDEGCHEDADGGRPVPAEGREQVGQRQARREERDPDDARLLPARRGRRPGLAPGRLVDRARGRLVEPPLDAGAVL